MGKYSKYNTKYSDEFLDDKKSKGYPLSFYLGRQYAEDEYHKKHNPIPKDMQNKLNGLREEGLSGRSLDNYLDDLDSLREDD